jgi:purine-binding chemotaxis protein CheW
MKLVLFSIDKIDFAIPLEIVEKIVSIVQITPLPNAPNYIIGTINYQSKILPVINMREIFLLQKREIEISDQLVIIRMSKMLIAIWVDYTTEIINTEDIEIISPDQFYIDSNKVKGLFKFKNGRVLISNPDKFFTPEQIEKLIILLSEER